jgi:hypothetical protein
VLPFAAPAAPAWLFLALTGVWAATSSALRAPPLMLLGKYAARPAVPWLAALTLLGLGLASALAPWLTLALRGVDPRWPFAAASLALAAATFGITGVERRLVAASSTATARAGAPAARHALPFLIAIALLAAGAQIHQFLNSAPLYLRHATPASLPWLMPVFWIGFNIALLPAGAVTQRRGGLVVMGAGGIAGAIAAALAMKAGSLALLVAIQALAGAAWGCVLASAVAAALAIGHTGREGTLTGALFSTLALAAATRIAIVAAELQRPPHDTAWLLWAPVATLGCAGVVLLALAARRRVAVRAAA